MQGYSLPWAYQGTHEGMIPEARGLDNSPKWVKEGIDWKGPGGNTSSFLRPVTRKTTGDIYTSELAPEKLIDSFLDI